MEIVLRRIVILLVIFFGGLLCIIAISGNEWKKVELGIEKVTYGLWKACLEINGQPNDCQTLNVSEIKDSKLKGEIQATRAFMIIGLLLYGVAFVMLAVAQFTKKNIFQKLILPVFLSIIVCGIIAMGCFTSFTKDISDRSQCAMNCFSFGWTYGIGWATVGLALIGTIISIIDFFMKSEGDGKK